MRAALVLSLSVLLCATANAATLRIVDVRSGERTVFETGLTAAGPESLRWTADGTALQIPVFDAGDVPVLRFGLDGSRRVLGKTRAYGSALSPDARTLAEQPLRPDGRLRLRDVATGRVLARVRVPPPSSATVLDGPGVTVLGPLDTTARVWSGDSRLLALDGPPRRGARSLLRVVEARTGRERCRVPGAQVAPVAFRGRRLLLRAKDDVPRVLTLPSAARRAAPAARRAAPAARRAAARAGRRRTACRVRRLAPPALTTAEPVALTPRGVLFAGADAFVVGDGPVLPTGPALGAPAPDGARVAYLNGNGLWVLRIAPPYRPPRRVARVRGNSITWSPDGRRVAVLGGGQ